MKRITRFIAISALFVCCGNPTDSENCTPSISSCSGDPCMYFHVYDRDGNFVKEGSSTGAYGVYWNGTDCNGNAVGCGAYRVDITLVQSGQKMTRSSAVLVTDSSTESSSGSYGCGLLEDSCAGVYSEAWGATVDEYGTITEELLCVCCK